MRCGRARASLAGTEGGCAIAYLADLSHQGFA
jgi:hypothetical protein